MKKILAFILVLGVCCTIVFSATAVDPAQCSHQKRIVTGSTYIPGGHFYGYTYKACGLYKFPHRHDFTGKYKNVTWTCVTCGDSIVVETREITSDTCAGAAYAH